MITLDLRHAIGRAVLETGSERVGKPGESVDPGLRTGGEPGRYASSVAFELAATVGTPPERIAAAIAERLRSEEPWIEKAEVTGRGYITVTVTPEALGRVADRIAEAGPDCARSDALAGHAVAGHLVARSAHVTAQGETREKWEEAATWDEARELVAAEVTARLAEAAGAEAERAEVAETKAARAETVESEAAGAKAEGDVAAEAEAAGTKAARDGKAKTGTARTGDAVNDNTVNDNFVDGSGTGRGRRGEGTIRSGENEPAPAAAVAFAGRDAVRFFLARAVPGQKISLDRLEMARHDLGNPAYAVRYAHARAASGVRWAVAAHPGQAGPQRYSAEPGELALLDALSWLPERVATAARRSRPDEFARYLERVADVTLAALTRPAGGKAPGSDRLALASAARAGLAAGLALLGVSAPERLLTQPTGEDRGLMSELASESVSTASRRMRPTSVSEEDS